MFLVFVSSACAGKLRTDAEGSPLSVGGFPDSWCSSDHAVFEG